MSFVYLHTGTMSCGKLLTIVFIGAASAVVVSSAGTIIKKIRDSAICVDVCMCVRERGGGRRESKIRHHLFITR